MKYDLFKDPNPSINSNNNINKSNKDSTQDETMQTNSTNFDLKLDLNLRGLQYESEHAIDDLFNYRKDIMSLNGDENSDDTQN